MATRALIDVDDDALVELVEQTNLEFVRLKEPCEGNPKPNARSFKAGKK